MNQPDKPPTLLQVIGSVLAAFFGVRSAKSRARDFKHGKASHFIIVGFVMTAAFVGIVILAVRLALRQAGM